MTSAWSVPDLFPAVRRAVALGALVGVSCLGGCDDDYLLVPGGSDGPGTDGPGTGGTDTDVPAEGWCAVAAAIQTSCLSCHSAASHLGGLDLETDAHAALVGVTSATDAGWTLVTAGAPDTSLLWVKLAGDVPAGLGGSMPPGRALSSGTVDLVRAWIVEGATDQCAAPIEPDPVERHHPTNQAEPTVHGFDAKFGVEACVDCHGADLTGQGAAVSCDTCHAPGWRTDCTFCHGDPAEGTGSPPVHLSGVDDGASASFVPHRAHTQATALHTAFDCSTCHVKPVDVLSPGHVFLGDTTPGIADVDFASGLSDAGRWNGSAGTCSNLYCHGYNGRDNGTMDHTGDVRTCHDCHPDPTSGRDAWEARMSGEHEDHLREGVTCWECHGGTTNAALAITNVSRHVNGVADVVLRSGMTRSGGACSGTCHGEDHEAERWR
ncbi:MAG: hypothetical protein H6733_17415 [Alphaproteobacteria bacterium]|nr:hypothetical protein [Alphaproteobacteria bacterium]